MASIFIKEIFQIEPGASKSCLYHFQTSVSTDNLSHTCLPTSGGDNKLSMNLKDDHKLSASKHHQ